MSESYRIMINVLFSVPYSRKKRSSMLSCSNNQKYLSKYAEMWVHVSYYIFVLLFFSGRENVIDDINESLIMICLLEITYVNVVRKYWIFRVFFFSSSEKSIYSKAMQESLMNFKNVKSYLDTHFFWDREKERKKTKKKETLFMWNAVASSFHCTFICSLISLFTLKCVPYNEFQRNICFVCTHQYNGNIK